MLGIRSLVPTLLSANKMELSTCNCLHAERVTYFGKKLIRTLNLIICTEMEPEVVEEITCSVDITENVLATVGGKSISSGDNVYVDDIIVFSCENGFERFGPMTTKCNPDGELSNMPPRCMPGTIIIIHYTRCLLI